MTERDALHRHIEAVWGLHVPPLDAVSIELAATESLPPWRIYQAWIGQDPITLWHPATAYGQRSQMLQHVQAAFNVPSTVPMMRSEMIWLPPASVLEDAQLPNQTVRLLTMSDVALVEDFAPDSVKHLLVNQSMPCVGVIADGRLVSVAHSSRRTEAACELGIDTLPTARRCGYALAATRCWTTLVRREGLLPIYSALADNTASLRLAQAAGYRLLARAVYGPLPDEQDE